MNSPGALVVGGVVILLLRLGNARAGHADITQRIEAQRGEVAAPGAAGFQVINMMTGIHCLVELQRCPMPEKDALASASPRWNFEPGH